MDGDTVTKDQRYKAFVEAIGRVVAAGWTVQIQEEFGTFLINVPGIDHYHCIDDRAFPIGATNWLNSLEIKNHG